jgi:hypothetical protein
MSFITAPYAMKQLIAYISPKAPPGDAGPPLD